MAENTVVLCGANSYNEKYYFNDEQGEGSRTLTYRRVYDENGEMVLDELLNPLLPSGGAAMDTYYEHNG